MELRRLLLPVIVLFVVLAGCPGQTAPDAPSISGPSEGEPGEVLTFRVDAVDPQDDSVAHRIDWGDGEASQWGDYVESGHDVYFYHSWDTAGTYAARAQAIDAAGHVSDWGPEHVVNVSMGDPPRAPSVGGPSSGWPGSGLEFSAVATDPENHDIAYRFCWGDGDTSSWGSYWPSGSPATVVHSWPDEGTYAVKAQARDAPGHESPWSDGHQVELTSPGFPHAVLDTIAACYDPLGGCALPNGDYVYMVGRGGEVSVIRTSDNEVVASVSVGAYPCYAVATPDGEYVYVTCSDAASVDVIRTSDNAVVATIPTLSDPLGIDILPGGDYVYLTHQQLGRVTVIRTSDNTVFDTLAVGSMPWGLVALPGGEYVYTANGGTDDVTVIRTSDNTVVATVPVGDYPGGIVASPGGEYVYVTVRDAGRVAVIRTSDNTVVDSIAVDGHPAGIGILPNGEYLYVSSYQGGCVTVIRTSDNQVAGEFDVPGRPDYYAMLPDNSALYLALRYGDGVLVVGFP